MNKSDAIKIIYRIEEDCELLGKMVVRTSEDREVLDGETKRNLQDSILRSISTLETMDSYLGTYMRMGKTDKYISVDRIINLPVEKVTLSELIEKQK